MVSTSRIRYYKENICQRLYPSILVYPLLVGPGGVRKGEGGEQDFHRQRASGTKTREHSVDCVGMIHKCIQCMEKKVV